MEKHLCLFEYLLETLARTHKPYSEIPGAVDNAQEQMFVIPKSSTMNVIVTVWVAMVVTVDCHRSLYDIRERMPWEAEEITSLVASTDVLQTFDKRLRSEYNTRYKIEYEWPIKYPTDGVNVAATNFNLILADTGYEHLVTILIVYVDTVLRLMKTLNVDIINQQTINLIQFGDNGIYCLATFLYDSGYRNVESIFETIHFLQSLSHASQTAAITASQLRRKLEIFVSKQQLKSSRNDTNVPPCTDPTELENKISEIKWELTKLSSIFCTESAPLINTTIYDKNTEFQDSKLLWLYTAGVYETKKCTIYVSTANAFRGFRNPTES